MVSPERRVVVLGLMVLGLIGPASGCGSNEQIAPKSERRAEAGTPPPAPTKATGKGVEKPFDPRAKLRESKKSE